ncbi:hypothetical protein RFI_17224 [Reticulomyxa filosa]|uniref:Uncharacterized protein n=1 Tax=Reticulomyxa filosa TaxID=46433 RepID=X6N1R2_RETFI|nr:hypothetical protein RFI_17224 [Reticulomyxa filosa]|eukprot:ETO19996.1 hypothetical protein RFI_17224 [Reticulomyxa filosa]
MYVYPFAILYSKDDLFQARLKEGKSLSVCFNCDEWDYNGEVYEGELYVRSFERGERFKPHSNCLMFVTDKGSEPMQIDLTDGDDKKWFDYIYFESLKFIHKQYISRNANPRRAVFLHITNATSADSIQKVFWDVQNIVIRSNLKRSGLQNFEKQKKKKKKKHFLSF